MLKCSLQVEVIPPCEMERRYIHLAEVKPRIKLIPPGIGNRMA